MKKYYFLILFVISATFSFAQKNSLPIIPQPDEVSLKSGYFKLSPETKIILNDETLKSDVDWFNEYLKKNYGFKLEMLAEKPKTENTISFEKPDFEAGWKEKYSIEIDESEVSILAEGDGAGFFYGLQTLVQLIPPPEIKSAKEATQKSFLIPCIYVKDGPRYEWRGMHLDVCRHFFPVSFVKRYIDLLAAYKMNTFHWHLTDDQGWRIEIKKYPKLTEFGAWRNGTLIGKYADNKFDTIRYGGSYTQKEIKEVVSYATKRHVTIIPEIEMPGHSLAAVASYPWVSCTGKKQEVAKTWGVFDDVYCTKDSTFKFLEEVLTEVIALFPGNYIHIGGDECPKTRWKTCPNCQALMRKENLKDENELQSYFIKRIEKFVNSKGKQIIGWDEILDGGLAPNAAVMSWRGTEGGITAAKQKHNVVMSPGKPCYFDHYQTRDKSHEPLAIGGFNPLDSVYNYNPTPKSLSSDEAKFIMGAQGNVWTEYILNEKQVEYMAVPRMIALAEVVWTKPENKDFSNFIERLNKNTAILDMWHINYAKFFLTQTK
ncbi:MAG TPA: beta-N-acetylhexosaminidase [Bacteroidia bacterium]|jgi:hexosaminidase|nr:beta-N-acetylhexosaminidase [Bacteroidia bacterium]